jgi:hypothetical protein
MSAADKYEQELAAWKARHGLANEHGIDLTTEDIMRAEDAKNPGNDYCWVCGGEFPIRAMFVDTNPYIYDGNTINENGYIAPDERHRTCKRCHDEQEEELGDQ